ncbi:MAG: hypothetical protein U0805_16105 [Pirellulales bacterium]
MSCSRCSAWFAAAIMCAVLGCGSSTSGTAGYNHLVAAADALAANDKEKAYSELSASIDTSPSVWAYFERARLNVEKGDENAASADCAEGLKLDPKYRDLLWLSGELKKPAAQRFKGKFAKPPAK